MSAYDEVTNLILNVSGRDDVDNLRKAVAQEEEALKKLIATHGLHDAPVRASGQTLQTLQDWLKTSERALRSSGGGFSSYQQNIQAASYALQDFTSTSGDFGAKLNSITNNLPQIFAGMGGLATVLSTVGTVATAVVRNWDTLSTVFSVKNPFPKAADDLAGLKRELEQATDRMGKLEAQGKGTAAQLAEYNTLRTRTVEIEKQVAEQMERQKRAKEFKELKDPELTAAEKERADALKPQFGDPNNAALYQAVENAAPRDTKAKLQEAYKKALKEAGDNLVAQPLNLTGMQAVLDEKADKLRKQIQAEEERIVKEARKTVEDAVIGGKEDAFNKILEMMSQRPEAFTDQQRQAFHTISPQGKLERKNFAARMGLDEHGKPLPVAKGDDDAGSDKPIIAIPHPGAGAARPAAPGGAVAPIGQGGGGVPVVGIPAVGGMMPIPFGPGMPGGGMDFDGFGGGMGWGMMPVPVGRRPAPVRGQGRRRSGKSGKSSGQIRREKIEAARAKSHAKNEELRQKGARAAANAPKRQPRMVAVKDPRTGQETLVPENEVGMSSPAPPRKEQPAWMPKPILDSVPTLGEEHAAARPDPRLQGKGGLVLPILGKGIPAPPTPALDAAAEQKAAAETGAQGPGIQPMSPVAAKPAAGAQASGGGDSDAVVQGFGRMAEMVRAGDAVTAEHIKQIYQCLAQLERFINQLGGNLANAQRRAFQGNDSFLAPNH